MDSLNLSIPEINQMLVRHEVENVVSHLVGSDNYQKNSNTLGMSSYLGGSDGASFQVTTHGSNAGMWYENNLAESPNTEGRGDLVELWALSRDISKGNALKEIKAFLGDTGRPKPNLAIVKKKKLSSKITENQSASISTIEKYQGRLRNSPEALAYLHNRGLTDSTIEHFKIGLSFPYKESRDALVFPVISSAGFVKPYAYYNVPGLSVNPAGKNGWRKGDVCVSYNVVPTRNHKLLFVAEGFKDLWMLHQVIQGTDLEDTLLIGTSTNGAVLPNEIQDNLLFFNEFEKVFLGHDKDQAGAKITSGWAAFSGIKSYSVEPPFELDEQDSDWTDYFRSGEYGAEDFVELLVNAPKISPLIIETKMKRLGDYKAGDITSSPNLDVTSAFFNGHLYYSLKVTEFGFDSEGNIGATENVKVIRSDKCRLDVYPIKQPVKYSLLETQLYRLSDFTIISRAPQVSNSSSWNWDHAALWLNGDFSPRNLSPIVDEMADLIKGRVWLPNNDDYEILALTMVVTYVQQIFDAVPFLLATGVSGSGKTELGRVVHALGCNAVSTGDISAATLTRLLDKTKGLLIIDDADKLGKKAKGNNASEIESMLQILKVSYKKSSAIRQVTDSKTMQVVELDFYGVKLFTNTTGMEDILATRTIPIHTRKPLHQFKQSEMPVSKFKALRGELHAWAMENATTVDRIYKNYSVSNRDDEITTPFRVFADLADRQDWHELSSRLVDRLVLEREANQSDSPDGYLREAVLNIAKRGFLSVTMEHVIMEMTMLVPDNFGKSYVSEIPEWQQTAWVKNQINSLGFLGCKAGKRVRVSGKAVPLQRLFPFSESLFQEIRKASESVYNVIVQGVRLNGKEFCRQHIRCFDCPYGNIPCDIRSKTNKR
jgi:hypothetical protein